MGEGVRDHVTVIITNGSGGLHCCFHIAGLDEFPFLLRVMCPHAGQIISLQFDLDLQEQLEGKIQECYGLAKDQAKKDGEDWFNSLP